MNAPGIVFVGFLVVVLHCLFLTGSVWNIRRAHAAYATRRPRHPEDVAVFVPVWRLNQRARDCILSLLRQSLRPRRLVIIMESDQATACEWLREQANQYPELRLVFAPSATHCSQKSLNLLTGLKAFPEATYYAFCDADVIPGPDWLADHVLRLTEKPDVDLISTHQWVHRRPGAGNFYLTAIHSMMLTLGCHPWIQRSGVWGGSFVIRRESFEREQVARIWAQTIVDDVTLQNLVNRGRLRTMYLPELMLDGTAPDMGYLETDRWFTRQMTYVKLYTPDIWIILTVIHTIVTLSYMMMLAAPFVALLSPEHSVRALLLAGPGLLHAICVPVVRRIRREDQEPYSVWLAMSWFCMLTTGLVFLATAFLYHINWGERTYRLNLTGRVLSVERDDDTEGRWAA